MKIALKSWFRFKNGEITINDTPIANPVDEPWELLSYYRFIAAEYPKFHKMDRLAKVSFLGIEALIAQNKELKSVADDGVALLFANSETSSATDTLFQTSYQVDQAPSPSLFVYTLPNIALGEIAIRNKWYGENMFSVLPNFVTSYYKDFAETYFIGGAEFVIGGWVDVSEAMDAFFFVLEQKEESKDAFSFIEEIYKRN